MPGKGRDWGYTSYYEDKKTGETRLIYTSYEKDGSVNRYKDNGDGGHGHAHWNNRDDYDAGEEPDWSRQESNSSPNPDDSEIQDNGGCYLTTIHLLITDIKELYKCLKINSLVLIKII